MQRRTPRRLESRLNGNEHDEIQTDGINDLIVRLDEGSTLGWSGERPSVVVLGG